MPHFKTVDLHLDWNWMLRGKGAKNSKECGPKNYCAARWIATGNAGMIIPPMNIHSR
jgi:hypothetical protein